MTSKKKSTSNSSLKECGVCPDHWGNPPLKKTRDRRRFPEPWSHCYGSGTVKHWIEEKKLPDSLN